MRCHDVGFLEEEPLHIFGLMQRKIDQGEEAPLMTKKKRVDGGSRAVFRSQSSAQMPTVPCTRDERRVTVPARPHASKKAASQTPPLLVPCSLVLRRNESLQGLEFAHRLPPPSHNQRAPLIAPMMTGSRNCGSCGHIRTISNLLGARPLNFIRREKRVEAKDSWRLR